MKETNYSIDGQKLAYEELENGYMIYKGGTAWIHQTEPHIPDKNLSYEENAIKQIEEIVASHEEAANAEKENEALKEQVKLQDEAINELASLVSELMMSKEVE